MDINKIMSKLTEDEKIALVSGTDFMNTNPVPRLNIPSVCMSDGPHGLRKQKGKNDNGVSQSEKATSFPTAVTMASGWNPENARKAGAAIGRECIHYGVDIILGPGVNIKRNPLCGRNFEYYSEDPLLSGEMGCAHVGGVKSTGVGVSVKHYALNSNENYRYMGDSIADGRAMREIYLKSFEKIVKREKPETLMCAYNKLGGEFCSENKWLLTDVLRGDWGFDGVVMSDWGAVRDRAQGIYAGLDLEMPGDTAVCRKRIKDALENGELERERLDAAVINILKLIEKCSRKKTAEADFEKHHFLAGEIASDCAVLMKNDGVLPLCKDERLFICGELFTKMRYQGSGSSMINPACLTTPEDAFNENKADYIYCAGYRENTTETDEALISEALEKSAGFDKVLLFAGLTELTESEGFDRDDMKLPENQLALINALIKAGRKIILVLFGGSVFELPFINDISAALNMFLPGQNGGTAVYELLLGLKNPSGHLSETWPLEYKDVPYGDIFGKGINELYKESVFVGYRYYSTVNKAVAFPFGFGLSYTSFEWSDIKLFRDGDEIKVTCRVKNTGGAAGADVCQLYVKAPESDVIKPLRELYAFEKVYLEKGEEKTAVLSFSVDDLRYYNIKTKEWTLEGGEYEIQLCRDSSTPVLSLKLQTEKDSAPSPYTEKVIKAYKNDPADIDDETFSVLYGKALPQVPKITPLTTESRFSDFNSTFMGKMILSAVLSFASGDIKKARKLPEGQERDNKIKGAVFMRRVLESNNLRSMSMCAGKMLSFNIAEGIVSIANGKIIRGIKQMCKKIKVPALPKDIK